MSSFIWRQLIVLFLLFALPVSVWADQDVLLSSDDHPRLILRGQEQINAIRKAAATESGKKIVARIESAIQVLENASLTGKHREARRERGFQAAGLYALDLIADDSKHVREAEQLILREIVRYPMTSRLEVTDRAVRLQGAVIAYDLGYAKLSEASRKAMEKYFETEADALLEKVNGIERVDLGNETHAMVVGTVGMVELVMLNGKYDPQGDTRLAKIQKTVRAYLDAIEKRENTAEGGESVRQAMLASGLLPFIWAHERVTGVDLSEHASVQKMMHPMIYQTIPKAGMPVLGSLTASLDRTGMFAFAGGMLKQPDDLAATAWLFHQLDGDTFLGVVRPHQALYMLIGRLDQVEAKSPDELEGWPKCVSKEKTGIVTVRSAWQNSDDQVVVMENGRFRWLGFGKRWVSLPGEHSTMYGNPETTRRVDNRYMHFYDWMAKTNKKGKTVYLRQDSHSFLDSQYDNKTDTANASFKSEGTIKRLIASDTYEDKQKQKITVEYADGGKYEANRTYGIKLTGLGSCDGLVAIRDQVTKGLGQDNIWGLHLGWEEKITAEGNRFELIQGDKKLVGIALSPADLTWETSSNPPYMQFVYLKTAAEQVDVLLMILPKDEQVPDMQAGKVNFDQGVQVGKTTIKIIDGKFIIQ